MTTYTMLAMIVLGLAADKDLDNLQGTWQVEKLVGRGKEIDGPQARAITFVVKGDKINRLVNGEDRNDPATIKLDTKVKPAHVILIVLKRTKK